MIKALILDADGVLINAERFSRQLARDYGITTEMTSEFFRGPFQDCLIGKKDLRTEISQYLKEWGWKGTTDELLKYWFDSEHKKDGELIAYIKVLKTKGIKYFIATNNEKHRTEYLINQMGFGQIFDKVYGSGHIGYKKPAQEFFKHIIDEQNLNKDKTLFWDDDLENIEGAKHVGLQAELYTDFENFRSKMNKYLN